MTDLNDPLDELFGGAPTGAPRPMARPELADISAPRFEENCRKCGGSGNWRPGYPCFACKGKGKLTFKSSYADRAKARTKATERKVAKSQNAIADFKAAHKAEAEWIVANTERGFEFAVNMRSAIERFGYLTANQLAAVQRLVAREVASVTERVAREAAAPTIEGVDLLKAAFDKAVAYSAEKGLKMSPRITVGGITISPAKAASKNPGALYVKSGDDYLGKIAGGRFLAVQACTAEQKAKVLAFVANPAEAAKVYGQTTGTCCVCNATLISKWKHRGIGPICAEKFGWGE